MIKPIKINGIDTGYLACSTGKIYSTKSGEVKELKGWLEHSRPGYSKRYWRVKINGKKYYKHRLILSVFDRWPEFGEVARHLDDNEFNNNWPENLKWGSIEENVEDRERNKNIKEVETKEENYEWLEQKESKDLPF